MIWIDWKLLFTYEIMKPLRLRYISDKCLFKLIVPHTETAIKLIIAVHIVVNYFQQLL